MGIARLPAKMAFKTYRMDIKEHSYLTDYFKNRGFDYVEYLGEFLGCRVYRACYNSEDEIKVEDMFDINKRKYVEIDRSKNHEYMLSLVKNN